MVVHNLAKVGKEKIATPMLEEYLRQMRPPSQGQVYQPRLDWWFAIVIGVLVAAIFTPLLGWDKKAGLDAGAVGFLAGWAAFYYRRHQRSLQIQALEPGLKATWQRWERAKRLPHLVQQDLNKFVPGPVLASLERAARAWHLAREELVSIAVIEPQFAEEIQSEIDASMMAAVASVAPVTRKDDEGRKALRILEADTDLMSRVCLRIDREGDRLSRWADDTQTVGDSRHVSLRERLTQAQAERAAAEAELNQALS